jgi:PIN domain nuclease of toxin-antitoxin system
MDILLDTHTFLWWLAGNAALSPSAKAAIADESNGVFVSAVSAWEITTKHRLGKLVHVSAIVADFEGVIVNAGFTPLSVTVRHGQVAGALPGPHRDPFDRMLIAQAMVNHLALVSNEQPFDAYGVARLW